MIATLKVAALHKTFEHFSRDQELFFFLFIQFYKLLLVFVGRILKRFKSAVRTLIKNFLDMWKTHEIFTSGAVDGYFDSLQANDATVFTLIVTTMGWTNWLVHVFYWIKYDNSLALWNWSYNHMNSQNALKEKFVNAETSIGITR